MLLLHKKTIADLGRLRGDLAADAPARSKGLAFQLRAEPGAEVFGVGKGAPHAVARRLDDDAAFDAAVFQGGVHGLSAPCGSCSIATVWLRFSSMEQ